MDDIDRDEFLKRFGYYQSLGYQYFERYRGWTLVTPNGWRFECTWYHEILDAVRDFEAHYKFSRKPSKYRKNMNEETNTDD